MDEQPSNSIKTSTVSGERPRSASPTTGDGVEDETQEDEPSSSLPKASRSQELDNFRQQWKNELAKTSPNHEESSVESSMKDLTKPSEPSAMGNQNDTTDNIYKKAKALYLNGVHEERLGRLYEAISFYRRAVQLVPDIEFHIANGLDYSEQNSSVSDLSTDDSGPEDSNTASDDDEPTEIPDLITHIEKVLNKSGAFRFCKPAKHQNSTHLSELPHEVFTYIMKWVVSSDLDCYSLEETSKVCRGFYLSARDSGVWRLACLKVWGVNCGLPNKYGSWRNMFIYRPHLWFHGAYISKTSYVRYGESSFQDSNYRPCYIVDYFRYLRFFPEGIVLMLTTPDDPYQSLAKLRQKKARHPTVMSGHYRLVGSVVTIILKRPKAASLDYLGASSALGYSKHKRQPLRPKMGQDLGEESFHIELEIQAVKQRPNFRLVWKQYSLHRLFRNCQETVSDIDINPANFPPFLFSRVKSFNMNSEFPLQ